MHHPRHDDHGELLVLALLLDDEDTPSPEDERGCLGAIAMLILGSMVLVVLAIGLVVVLHSVHPAPPIATPYVQETHATGN